MVKSGAGRATDGAIKTASPENIARQCAAIALPPATCRQTIAAGIGPDKGAVAADFTRSALKLDSYVRLGRHDSQQSAWHADRLSHPASLLRLCPGLWRILAPAQGSATQLLQKL